MDTALHKNETKLGVFVLWKITSNCSASHLSPASRGQGVVRHSWHTKANQLTDLPLLLQVLADGHSLLNEVVEVLRQGGRKTWKQDVPLNTTPVNTRWTPLTL